MIGFPWFLHFDITKGCNFSCNFCLTDSGQALGNELTYNEIISLLDDVYETGTIFLKILGGEPFYRSDIIGVMKYAVEKGMYISFSSNGSFFNKKVVNEISKLSDHIEYIQISVYGSCPERYKRITGSQGHYNLVLRGLENLTEIGIQFYILSVMTANNLDDMIHIQKLISDYNVVEFRLTEKIDIGRGFDPISSRHISGKKVLLNMIETFRKLKVNWEKHDFVKPVINARPLYGEYLTDKTGLDYYYQPCIAGKNLIYVDSKGDCAPCPFLDIVGAAKYGGLNVRKQNLEEIWNSEKFHRFRSLFEPKENPQYINVKCPYYSQCSPCVLTPCACMKKIKNIRLALE